MQGNKKTVLILFVLLIAAMATTMATFRGQAGSNPQTKQKSQIPVEDYPIAEYESQEPSDLTERVKRQARGARHGIRDQRIKNVRDFMITENSWPVEMSQPPDHAPPEPAIPANQSDTVVIGEVKGARAFLSNDKTAIYSEFEVTVSEMLKNGSSLQMVPGDSIIAERSGGRVRLPSGKTILHGFSHKSMPRVGRRYVLFLKYNDEGQDFSIITGYELRAGKAFPLDGVPKDRYKMPQFAAFEGKDEAEFLNEVRAAILQSPQVTTEKGTGR